MPNGALLFNITPLPILSVLVWFFLCIVAMYLARRPFHAAVKASAQMINHLLRTLAATIKLAERRLDARNRDVLLVSARQTAVARIRRDVERMDQALQHSLAGYPKLQRQIREQLQSLERDYQRCEDAPQGLSDWVRVIDAIAAIKPPGDPMVASILETIHSTLESQHRTALADYRKSMSRRHTILARLAPRWQSVGKRLARIEASLEGITERTHLVERAVADYNTLNASPDAAHSRLFVSSLARLMGASLALGVFAVGAIINFNLVALPLTDMVGGNSFIGPFKTADVVGGFIVCMVLVLGMFLMDALRITHFFYAIATMNHRRRSIFLWSLAAVLAALAGVEASLAFMRDRMLADAEALRQSLYGIDAPLAAAPPIAAVAQTALGFMMPLILVMAAIPLAAFIASLRTIVGMITAWSMRSVAVALRLGGSLARRLARWINTLYDLMIFPALWLEALPGSRWSEIRQAGGGTRGTMASRQSGAMLGEKISGKQGDAACNGRD